MAYAVTTIGGIGGAQNMTNPDESRDALDPLLLPLGLYGQQRGLIFGLIGGAVLGAVAAFAIGRLHK